MLRSVRIIKRFSTPASIRPSFRPSIHPKIGYFYFSRTLIVDNLEMQNISARKYLKESQEFGQWAAKDREKRAPPLTPEQQEQLQSYLVLMASSNKDVYPTERDEWRQKQKWWMTTQSLGFTVCGISGECRFRTTRNVVCIRFPYLVYFELVKLGGYYVMRASSHSTVRVERWTLRCALQSEILPPHIVPSYERLGRIVLWMQLLSHPPTRNNVVSCFQWLSH